MNTEDQVTLDEIQQIAFCVDLTRGERFFLIMYLLLYGFQEIQAFRAEIAIDMQMEMQACKNNLKRLKLKGILQISSHSHNGIKVRAIRNSWNKIKRKH